MMTISTTTVIVSIAAAVAAVSACAPLADKADNSYRGTVAAPTVTSGFSTPSAPAVPAVPAVPVTISGTGEGVATADLVATGYTVFYQASSRAIIVKPVNADGSTGSSIINAMGDDGGATGTTTFRSTGRTTFHVSNTRGPWSLTFTPLS